MAVIMAVVVNYNSHGNDGGDNHYHYCHYHGANDAGSDGDDCDDNGNGYVLFIVIWFDFLDYSNSFHTG